MKNIFYILSTILLFSLTSNAQSLMDRVNKTKSEAAKPAPRTNAQYEKNPSQPKVDNHNNYSNLPTTSTSNYVNIRNRWKGSFINNEYGSLTTSALGKPDWHSAMWVFEAVPGTRFIKIKNRWKGTYLNIESGSLEASSLGAPGWHSAQWLLEKIPGTSFFRIKNRWKGTYLHNQYGTLTCSALGDNSWHSAQWETKVPIVGTLVAQSTTSYNGPTSMMYFRYTDQVQGGRGLDLKVGSQIKVLPNQTIKPSEGLSFDPSNPKICGKIFTIASLNPLRFTEPFPENMRNTHNSSFALKVVKIR